MKRALDWRHWRHAAWMLAGAMAFVAALLAIRAPTAGLDQAFHDGVLRLQPRPPHPDILIVAIDDKSLAALGRWPWPRSRHAALIQRLTESGARAVGLDLLLLEPDAEDPAQDAALARAMAASGRVVLPMMMQTIDGLATPVTPLPAFGQSALSLGHVHLPLDGDGLVRRVFLREGMARRHWAPFAQEIYRHADPAARLPATPWPTPASGPAWQRLDPAGIAYAGPAGHFPRVPYVDVLEGLVPAERLRDKLVLVGVTAAGLGDEFATPQSHQQTLMPGVEVHANVLDTLLRQRALSPAPPLQAWLFSLLPVGLMVLAMATRRLGPGAWLGLAAALGGGAVAAAIAAQRGLGLQLSPLPGILALALIGLLYWWRQWQLSTRYLTDELLRFRGSQAHLRAPPAPGHGLGDPLRQRIRSLRELVQQLRDVHRFVKDSLEALPDATLVCDADGRIQLANAAAACLARQLDGAPEPPVNEDRRSRPGDALQGRRVADLLRALRFPGGDAQDVVRELMRWPEQAASVPATSAQERDYLIKCVPTHDARARHAGWAVSIVDVTDIHEAQRQRDQAIGFMSHDMRAPQSAILSLLELRRTRPELLSAAQFEERVERHARKALSMADGFIQLARAQSRDYLLQPLDLVDLVRETMDDAWEMAQRHRIALRYAPGPDSADAQADRELFGRAVDNLLGNAIKFSPHGATVEVAVRAEPDHWVVSVSDQGPGISAEAQAELFTPYFRDPSASHVEGAGLGLPFVHTVMSRHGGRVEVHSRPGAGCRFELWLPLAAPSP